MTSPRKIAVLGANSFSGQDFVDLLLRDPANDVIGVSRSPLRSTVFVHDSLHAEDGRFRYFQFDLNHHLDRLLDVLDAERPAWIVNFAAQSEVAPSWENPEQWFQTNCVSLARLVNHLARRNYVERYLHVSSPEVYGSCRGTVTEDAPLNPSTPYAASKAGADLLLETYRRHFDFPLLTVRATNVYGPRQQLFKLIPRSAIYLKLGRTISLHGGGRAVKSYIHIRDVSRGELAILERGTIGETYHLSPDAGVAVCDVVRRLCEKYGTPFEEAVESTGERLGQDAAYVIDSSKARESLAWSPQVPLETGLDEVLAWVDREWDVIRQLPLEYQHVA